MPGDKGMGMTTVPTGWFSRNWKWFMPLVIGGPLLVLVLFVWSMLTLIGSVMRDSQP